jgi:predicted nucleic acid-binding protein
LILLDANVLMYAVGAEHPHKQPSVSMLERIGAGEIEAVIDAETLQELLHRYRAIGRWETAREIYVLTRRLFPVVLPITAEIVDEAQRLMDRYRTLLARDAVHAATVRLHDLAAICSYDRDFDVIDGLRRMEPDAIPE